MLVVLGVTKPGQVRLNESLHEVRYFCLMSQFGDVIMIAGPRGRRESKAKWYANLKDGRRCLHRIETWLDSGAVADQAERRNEGVKMCE